MSFALIKGGLIFFCFALKKLLEALLMVTGIKLPFFFCYYEQPDILVR